MKYNQPFKIIAVCFAIALSSLTAVAQTANQSSGPAMTETTGNQTDRRDNGMNYSWVGLIGLLGLAGLLKNRHETHDHVPAGARHA